MVWGTDSHTADQSSSKALVEGPSQHTPEGARPSRQMRLFRLALLCLTVSCKAEPTEKRQLAPLERVQPMNPFPTGKLVVYPGQGIVQIEGTEQREGKSFVRLKHPTMTIHVPVESLAKAVRQPIATAQAEVLLARLRSRDGEPDMRHFAHRHRDVMRVMVKGTLEQQTEALHRLYSSPFTPTFGERKLMTMLEDIVLGELVLATAAPATLDALEQQRDALASAQRESQPVFSATKERPRDPPPEPNRPKDPFGLSHVEYLGTFTVGSETIAAGDPATVGHAKPGAPERASYVVLDAVKGKWHGYVRTGDDGIELLFAFADPSLTRGAVSKPSRSQVGRLWVDSGQMSIVDGAMRADDQTRDAMLFPLFQETLVLDRGCMSRSGFGDGIYPVFATTEAGKVTWLGVDFHDEEGGDATSTRKFMEEMEKKIRLGR